MDKPSLSTGLPALDTVLDGLRPGDNVVFRVDSLEDYLFFAEPFCRHVTSIGQPLVYFRFAKHPPLVAPGPGIITHSINPGKGFENFITQIHKKIREQGRGGFYLFDSMSDLALDCYSERMIGNFFKLTCPYLFQLETVAFFSIYRYYHCYHAAGPVAETTQILIDVYRHQGTVYIQPTKVDKRFSPTMFTLHRWEPDEFKPVMDSAVTADVLTSAPWPGLRSASYRMVGIWDKKFIRAEEMLQDLKTGSGSPEKVQDMFRQLLRQLLSHDERMLRLAEKYFTLEDMIYIWKRMIGCGMIGGKSVGMLLARKILKSSGGRWDQVLEAHDSFFIGTDVFYTFLVENGLWAERQHQKDPAAFREGVEIAQNKMRQGQFPEYILKRFSDMLEYYGQAPIIVRSSSMMEDTFTSAFAGKYESIFCSNQGTHEERLKDFINAVRTIYASTMSVEALTYRAQRGVLDQDEQMALLVQRVSGTNYGRYFFPMFAGVSFSYNHYAWSRQIDPEAGVMRIVFGLGTRAVDRSDDDYTRVVALNAPEKRPESNFDQVKRYAQRRVDVLDLQLNQFSQVDFVDIVNRTPTLPLGLFAIRDQEVERYAQERGLDLCSWVITFDNLLLKTRFIEDIRGVLKVLREAYGSHIDLEFTANTMPDGTYKINVVQCRPLQVQEAGGPAVPLPPIDPRHCILKAQGAVIGQSRAHPVDRLIYVVPEVYGQFPESKRYALARVIGKITHLNLRHSMIVIGPGRWGTSTPALGVPVSFMEINPASVMCEIDSMHAGLVPDLSIGTHFFNEMVERNMLYIAYFTGTEGNILNREFLAQTPNSLPAILPEAAEWAPVIKVIDRDANRPLFLNANSLEQSAVIYLEK